MRNFVDYYIYYTERVKHINDACLNAPVELIAQMEAQYRKRIDEIAEFIVNAGEGNKLLMLAGPSSSGKTTTAAMLCRSIRRRGANAVRISLDDFFLGGDQAPLLEDGTRDFESVEALDIPLMQRCLLELVDKGCTDMPRFDFTVKARADKPQHIELGYNSVAIVEGIHALNPVVTDCLPDEQMLKVYISVKQGIKEGDRTAIGPYDLRLVRRIVRDYHFRSTSPEVTMSMWPSVRRGESLYIAPHKRTANVTINSIHIYEPCVLGPLALELLSKVEPSSEHYKLARSLMRKLRRFERLDESLVPPDSLVREFIGGCIL